MASGAVTSWAKATSTPATTVSPAWTGRAVRRLRISSTSVPMFVSLLGVGPLAEQGVDLGIGEGAGVRTPLDLGGDAVQLGFVEPEAELRGAVADGMAAGQPVTGEDLAFAAEARRVED